MTTARDLEQQIADQDFDKQTFDAAQTGPDATFRRDDAGKLHLNKDQQPLTAAQEITTLDPAADEHAPKPDEGASHEQVSLGKSLEPVPPKDVTLIKARSDEHVEWVRDETVQDAPEAETNRIKEDAYKKVEETYQKSASQQRKPKDARKDASEDAKAIAETEWLAAREPITRDAADKDTRNLVVALDPPDIGQGACGLMGGGFERRPGKSSLVHNDGGKVGAAVVGKRTLTEQFPQQPRPGPHPGEWLIHGPDGSETGDPVQRKVVDAGYGDIVAAAATPVQRSADQAGSTAGSGVQQVAAAGVAGGGSSLPHRERIQQLFGRHDISGVHAHVGGVAATASQALGAKGYATGNHAAFREYPDLHTAAHEAAHVVQQRGGVQLKGGIDQPGDVYECHADAVADAVVAGKSAAPLLDQVPGGGQTQIAVQRAPANSATPAAAADDHAPEVTPPTGGIDKPGFIDNSDGSNIRTGPAEGGGKLVRSQPLPPATRVFVSGTHPSAPEWWYVTAFLDNTMVRGYVQGFRVTTDLPEPTAKLHQVVDGDTAEKLAVQEYKSSVRDGHDLRYYENVLLYVNQQRGRAGITGSYQAPGVLGGGSNNVQLVVGHRVWLVSPAFAKALEGVVLDGSLTGGAVAKARRFVAHVEDILKSVTESRHHFGEVAGEYAQAIRDHLPEIAGIVAAFIIAEATSAFLAATPTGVGQIAAVVIQLGLTAFGAAGAIQAGAEAMKHAGHWLTLAWTAKGDDKQIAAASKEFLKMLVGIAMAAFSALGAKANYGNALKIANSMPTGGLPAFAIAGGGRFGGAGAGTGVLVGPGTGSLGVAGNTMMQADDKNGGGGKDGTQSTDPAKELEDIKQKLEADELSGKQKQALRARKKELQEQLGKGASESVQDDIPTPSEFKDRAPALSRKEAATDVPSSIENWPDARPGVHENGTTFATRMMNKRYGVGGWKKAGQHNTEFSQLRKFADRAFE